MRSLAYKRLAGRLFGLLKRSCNRRAIITYHSVGSRGPWSVPIEQFVEQMKWLKSNANVLSMDEIVSGKEVKGLNITITFDDGYRCLHNIVDPILAEHGFPAIVYINTEVISEEKPMLSNSDKGYYSDEEFLTWSDVMELRKKSWTIGSHSAKHMDMTKLAIEDLEHQVTESKKVIESKLGVRCNHFCYPWGLYNERTQQVLHKAGYHNAVCTYHAPLSKQHNRFALPRLDIRSEYTLKDFTSVVCGHWDFIGWVHGFKGRYSRDSSY